MNMWRIAVHCLERKKLILFNSSKVQKEMLGVSHHALFFPADHIKKNLQVSFCKVEFNYLSVMGHMAPNLTDQRSMHTSAYKLSEWAVFQSSLNHFKDL